MRPANDLMLMVVYVLGSNGWPVVMDVEGEVTFIRSDRNLSRCLGGKGQERDWSLMSKYLHMFTVLIVGLKIKEETVKKDRLMFIFMYLCGEGHSLSRIDAPISKLSMFYKCTKCQRVIGEYHARTCIHACKEVRKMLSKRV